jgi:hypothetical protein
MEAFEDPRNPGNGVEHLTGEVCIERGCDKPAGTAWSPWWCFEHNVERMRRITTRLEGLASTGEVRDGED